MTAVTKRITKRPPSQLYKLTDIQVEAGKSMGIPRKPYLPVSKTFMKNIS